MIKGMSHIKKKLNNSIENTEILGDTRRNRQKHASNRSL